MKIGIFDFKITVRGEYFFPELILDNKILYTYGGFPTKQEAFDAGIKNLEALFQGFLDQLTKPKYQTKSRSVDAVQWFPGVKIEGVSQYDGRYWYCEMAIDPRDWIVDDKLYCDSTFKHLFEVVQ